MSLPGGVGIDKGPGSFVRNLNLGSEHRSKLKVSPIDHVNYLSHNPGFPYTQVHHIGGYDELRLVPLSSLETDFFPVKARIEIATNTLAAGSIWNVRSAIYYIDKDRMVFIRVPGTFVSWTLTDSTTAREFIQDMPDKSTLVGGRKYFIATLQTRPVIVAGSVTLGCVTVGVPHLGLPFYLYWDASLWAHELPAEVSLQRAKDNWFATPEWALQQTVPIVTYHSLMGSRLTVEGI